jgi:hypothetical protein
MKDAGLVVWETTLKSTPTLSIRRLRMQLDTRHRLHRLLAVCEQEPALAIRPPTSY